MILTVPEEIDLIRRAGRIDGEVLAELAALVRPGISTGQLDQAAEAMILSRGGLPTFKGYRDFPRTACISVNEEVVHGIPSEHKLLKEGDIVSLDLGCTIRREANGRSFDFIGDTAVTVPVGVVSPRLARLIDDTRAALYAGIKKALAGASLDDIGGAIEDIAATGGYGIVREYGGHGIGFDFHEQPTILNYRTGSRVRLKPGMVIAIEPMFNLGGDRVRVKKDGWTVVTQDYKPSAHFEHTLLVTDAEPEVLTRRPDEVVA